jgi:hypothetical protein
VNEAIEWTRCIVTRSIPILSPTATASSLQGSQFFRTVPSNTFQAHALWSILLRMEADNVAVMSSDDAYGLDMASSFAGVVQLDSSLPIEISLSTSLSSSLPWLIAAELTAAGMSSNASAASAVAHFGGSISTATATSALAGLAQIDSFLTQVERLPLTRTVLFACPREMADAALLCASKRGLLRGRAWVGSDAVGSGVPGSTLANATSRSAVVASATGLLTIASSALYPSARRDAILANWTSRARVPPGGFVTLPLTTLQQHWTQYGQVLDNGDGVPSPTSFWEAVSDSVTSAVRAISLACAAVSPRGSGVCGAQWTAPATNQSCPSHWLSSSPSFAMCNATVVDCQQASSFACNASATVPCSLPVTRCRSGKLVSCSNGTAVCDGRSQPCVPLAQACAFDPVVSRAQVLEQLSLARAQFLAKSTATQPFIPLASSALGVALHLTGDGRASANFELFNFAGSNSDKLLLWKLEAVASPSSALGGSITSVKSSLWNSTTLTRLSANSVVGSEWIWPGFGGVRTSAPSLGIAFRVGVARRALLNVSFVEVSPLIAAIESARARLPAMLAEYVTDTSQISQSLTRLGPTAFQPETISATDLDQLFIELESFSSRRFDLIIAAGTDDLTAAAVAQAAQRRPYSTFLLTRDLAPGTRHPSNLIVTLLRTDEAAFVAGVVAARMTTFFRGAPVPLRVDSSNHPIDAPFVDANQNFIEEVVSLPVAVLHGPLLTPASRRLVHGFRAGVRSVCPQCYRSLHEIVEDENPLLAQLWLLGNLTQVIDSGARVVMITGLSAQLTVLAATRLADQQTEIYVMLDSQEAWDAVNASTLSQVAQHTLGPQQAARRMSRIVGHVFSRLENVVFDVVQEVSRVKSRQQGLVEVSQRSLQLQSGGPLQTNSSFRQLGVAVNAVGFELKTTLATVTDPSFVLQSAAWAKNGLELQSLLTKTFLDTGLPFLEPSSCEVGEAFRVGEDPSLSQCFKCPESTFSLQRGQSCIPCPSEAYCNGGAHLAARRNFWVGDDLRSVYPCNPYSCCLSDNCSHPENPSLSFHERALASVRRCANNRTGTVCGHCPEGQYLISQASGCGICDGIDWIPVGAFLGACALFILYMLIRNHDARSATLTVAIDYMNSAFLVFSPAREFAFTISFGAMTMELTAAPFSRGCMAPLSPLARLVSPYFIPSAMLLFLAIAWMYAGFMNCVCRSKYTWSSWRLQLVLWVIVTVAYSALSRVGLEAVTCRTVQKERVVASNPDIPCEGDSYIIVASISAFIAAVTLLGVPAFVYVTNFRVLTALGVHSAISSVTMVTRVAQQASEAMRKLAIKAHQARERVALRKAAKVSLESESASPRAVEVRSPALTDDRHDSTEGVSQPWQAFVAGLRSQSLAYELEVGAKPRKSILGMLGIDQSAQRKRRFSSMGLPASHRGWIYDNVSNGFFWMHGVVGKAPFGPYYIHPDFATEQPVGPKGAKVLMGSGKNFDWSVVPRSEVAGILAAAESMAGPRRPFAKAAPPSKDICVALDPISGQLFAMNFAKSPDEDFLETMRSMRESSLVEPGGESIQPRGASRISIGREETEDSPPQAGSHRPFLSASAAEAKLAHPDGRDSKSGVHKRGGPPPVGASPATKRRRSILDDPEKLRKAMALTLLGGEENQQHVQRLVKEARADDDSSDTDEMPPVLPDEPPLRSKSAAVSKSSSAASVSKSSTRPPRARPQPRIAVDTASKRRLFDMNSELGQKAKEIVLRAGQNANIAADVDANTHVMRLMDIPADFRGSSRLYLPFRSAWRAHGYALLLLRRGLATVVYVLLSQLQDIKQVILFLYFLGWLLWQLGANPFLDGRDNSFAAVSLTIIVAVAGLELNFIARVVGPSWITWCQLVLLAIPFCYAVWAASGEIIDLLDERGWLPSRCRIDDRAKEFMQSHGVGYGAIRRELCLSYCEDCFFPQSCRRCCVQRCWCLLACCRVATCGGTLCCCRCGRSLVRARRAVAAKPASTAPLPRTSSRRGLVSAERAGDDVEPHYRIKQGSASIRPRSVRQ